MNKNPKKIKILYFEEAEDMGGSIISLLNIIKNLNKSKYDSVVFCLNEGEHCNYLKEKLGKDAKLATIVTPYVYWKKAFIKLVGPDIFRNDKFFYHILLRIPCLFFQKVFIFIFLLFFVKIKKIDLIHLNNGPYYPVVLLSKIVGIPCVCHLRSQPSKLTILTKLAGKGVRAFISVSKSVEKSYIEAGYPKDKFTTIYDGIDIDNKYLKIDQKSISNEFGLKENELIVGVVGRLTEKKGFTYFIKAIPLILSEFPDSKFFIVGDGDFFYKDNLKKMVKVLNIEKKVIFTGYRNDVMNIIKEMDIFVLPSLSNKESQGEGLPIVLLEAMLLGIPIIATDVAGVAEIVNNNVGILIPPEDSNAIAAAVINIAKNPSCGVSLAIKAKKAVMDKYTVENFISNIEKAYETSCFY